MANPERITRPALLVHAALLFALALPGCQWGAGGALRPQETRDENGFTITETARLGMGARARFETAVGAIEAGDYATGIELLEALTLEAPEVATLHIDLGMAYQRNEEFEEAEASLRKALALYPKHAIALNELGIVMRRQGEFDEARDAYQAALDRHPDFHHARKNLAILCDLYLGDLDCALTHYEQYQRVVPHDENVSIWISDLQNRRASGGQ